MATIDLKKSIKGLRFFTRRLSFFGTRQVNGDQYFFDRRGAGVIRDMEILKSNGERVKIRGMVDAGGSGGGTSMVISRPANTQMVSPGKAMEAYRSWAYAAIKPIADEIGAIEWRLFKKDKNGEQIEIDSHEFLTFLEAVNDFQTGPEFRHILVSHLELTGNAYLLLLNGSGDPVASAEEKPKSMYLLNPAEVEIKLDKIKFPYRIAGYKHTIDGKDRTYEAFQIVQIKYPNPLNPYLGMGTVQGIAEWLDNDNNSTEFLRKFFKNGAQIGVNIKTDMTSEEQLHELRDSFNEQHQGLENSFKAIFWPKGVEPVKTDVTFDKIGFDQISDTNRDKILAGFRVSKTILGTAESDTNRSTAETADYVFARRTIKPKMQLICSYLNEFLVPRFAEDIILSFTDPVPEDLEAKSAEMKNGIGALPILTVNEARQEYMGMEPVDGGDVLMVPNNYIPSSEAGLIPSSLVSPDKSMRKPTKRAKSKVGYMPMQSGSTKTQFARNSAVRKEIASSLADKIANIVLSIKKKGIKEMTDQEYDEVILKEKRDRYSKYAQEIRSALVKINNDQKEEVMRNLEQATKSIKAVDMSKLFDLSTWINITINAVTPIIESLFQKEADHALSLIDKPGLDIANTPSAQQAIKRAMSLMAETYNQNTVDLLESKINEGLEQGYGVDKLGELVSDVYAFKDQTAAERVALTESNRITNDAGKIAWKESGVVSEVKWVTSKRDNVCEFCAAMDGTTIDIKDNFFDKGDQATGNDGGTMDLDYSDVGGPPLHPNCHCGIRPVVDTSIQASLSTDIGTQKDVEDALIKLNKLDHGKE